MEGHSRLDHRRIAGTQREEMPLRPVRGKADTHGVGEALRHLAGEAGRLQGALAGRVDLARAAPGTKGLDTGVEHPEQGVGDPAMLRRRAPRDGRSSDHGVIAIHRRRRLQQHDIAGHDRPPLPGREAERGGGTGDDEGNAKEIAAGARRGGEHVRRDVVLARPRAHGGHGGLQALAGRACGAAHVIQLQRGLAATERLGHAVPILDSEGCAAFERAHRGGGERALLRLDPERTALRQTPAQLVHQHIDRIVAVTDGAKTGQRRRGETKRAVDDARDQHRRPRWQDQERLEGEVPHRAVAGEPEDGLRVGEKARVEGARREVGLHGGEPGCELLGRKGTFEHHAVGQRPVSR